MKTPPFLATLVTIALTCVIIVPTASAKDKKKNDAPKPAVVAPVPADPVDGLKPFIQNIEQLLALERSKAMHGFGEQAQGRLTVVRGEIAAKRATAQPAEQPRLDAAIATCDTIARALDERKTTVANMSASSAVSTSAMMNRTRKDKPGIVGYDRELTENDELKQIAKNNSNTITAASRNRWAQHAIELRQQVEASYARIAAAIPAS